RAAFYFSELVAESFDGVLFFHGSQAVPEDADLGEEVIERFAPSADDMSSHAFRVAGVASLFRRGRVRRILRQGVVAVVDLVDINPVPHEAAPRIVCKRP